MKLTKETIATLTKHNKINQSIKIVPNTKQLKSKNKTIMAYSTIDQEFPEMLGIYDLQEFISVVSLFEEPELDMSNPEYVIVKSNGQKLRYMNSPENLLGDSYIEKDLKLENETLSVNVTKEQISQVMKAANVMKMEYIGFTSKDGEIVFRAFQKTQGDGKESNEYAISLGETDQEFDLYYKTESLINILDSDCEITFDQRKAGVISRIVCGNFTYYVVLERGSEVS